ncbi:MAG: NADH:ubiquinone reductase (Na(+)-transporting) subunit A [Planctomycetota bacterium]|nr:NADH:ubiquinone reductase (Na(+)-transporting) subunit A [Planctomycetota bacterium]
MPTIKTRRGLNVPIHGAIQSSEIHEAPAPTQVALLPQESWGIKVAMLVQEGASVKIGTPLFADRRDEKVTFGSPAAGTVTEIRRGHRRAVLAVVIDVDGDECIEVPTLDASGASPDSIREALTASGLWPCLRQRPFDKVAQSGDTPRAIIVQAHDSRPLAAAPQDLLAGRKDAFQHGLALLHKMVGTKTFLCVKDGTNWQDWTAPGVTMQAFDGPHPSGTAGFSIHSLCPAGAEAITWHIDAQDVADIGETFLKGRIPTRRVVALTGPTANKPRLVATQRGAHVSTVVQDESSATETRVITGSVLEGQIANPTDPKSFLGRYSNQVSLMDGTTKRDFMAWALPVAGRFTTTNTMLDKFFKKKFKYDVDSNGSKRAIVPLGDYEKVMPMDILPTQLIKALAAHDLESAEKLGALELAEEDLALCEFVDTSKQPLTEMLRTMLTRIEKEG